MRYVVDEGSLQMFGLGDGAFADSVTALTRLLTTLRSQKEVIGIGTGWGSTPCREGLDLATVLADSDAEDRDERALLLGLLGKSPYWDDDPACVVDDVVTVAGVVHTSLAVAYAAQTVNQGHACAVVSTLHGGRRGSLPVEGPGLEPVEIHFEVTEGDVPSFLRTIFALEDVSEEDFFALAERCFPNLRFCASLAFRAFDGGYRRRDAVVDHLATLNDHFMAHFRGEDGNSARVSARLGIDVSIESGKTRQSKALMKHRKVEFEGAEYLCEWHSKLEPHQNRIHFDPTLMGTSSEYILVGIFATHLPT